jgi:predicted nucleotidyltransferase
MTPDTPHAAVPAAIRSDIARAVAILKEGGCSAVFLFGSGAAGTLTERSDLDLAVQGCPPEAFFRLLGRLLYELDRSVDLVDLDAPDPFAQMLQREGGLQRVG